MKVAVITSTRGRKTIQKAHLSILNQTYPATHYVFAHGKDCWDAVDKNMDGCNAQIVYLPRANGGGGFGMAPVFAMAGYCVTEDIVFYLDDDNWYEPDHIDSLVEIIEKNECVDGMVYGFKHSYERVNYFNLCAQDQITVKRIVEILLEETRLRDVRVKYTGGESGWKGDVPVFLLGNKKMSKLGWKPKHTSEEAIREAAKIVVKEYLRKMPLSWLSVQEQ